MKKVIALIVLLLLLILAVGAVFGIQYYNNTFISIDGQRYRRDIHSFTPETLSPELLQQLQELPELREVDLRNLQVSAQDYEAFCGALPACEIQWLVPFHGNYLPSDTTELTVSTLSEADIAMLEYLPAVTAINAESCTDYETLMSLIQARPDLAITYQVSVGGETWSQDTAEISLASADLAELEANIPYLPALQTVTLEDVPADPDAMLALQEAHPEITFSWQLEVCGVTVDAAATEIDLSGIVMENTEELESKLKYMPNLTKVDMCNCGISNEEMEALNNRHENTLFVWLVKIKGMEFRTDVKEMMPVKHDLWVNDQDCYNLRYFTELVALDLGHMFIYNCEFVRYMPHLKYLILADTDVSNISPLENLSELIYLEIFMCPIRDYSPLATLSALEDLNISYTYGDYEVIAQMNWLQRLWWGQAQESRITDAQRDYLRSVLVNTEIEFQPQSSTGKGWRLGQNYFDMRDIFGMGYMTA